MGNYDITLTQKDIYNFEIYAEDEKTATEIALRLFEQDKKSYFFDSDTDIEVVEIRKD